MKLIRHPRPGRTMTGPCVAAIGNFDGIHLGHQSVIAQLKENARRMNLPAAVITFEPQPMEVLRPDTAPARLSRFREKLEVLKGLDVDIVVGLRFDQALANLDARGFVERWLVGTLGIQGVIVGEDFRFGNQRGGDIDLLRGLGQENGFEVIPARTYHYNGLRVSSSLVRGFLAVGDFAEVAALLGRPYTLCGKVIHGDKRGRQLGFPTANLIVGRRNSPLAGVYVVRVHGIGAEPVHGVANIGTRPVFDGKRLLLETYLLDFEQQIYGRRISVEFLKHLREERDFPTVEALCEQMHKDVKRGRAWLARHHEHDSDNPGKMENG